MQNPLLRKARAEVREYGRVLADTAEKLMALGIDVASLETRLITAMEFAS